MQFVTGGNEPPNCPREQSDEKKIAADEALNLAKIFGQIMLAVCGVSLFGQPSEEGDRVRPRKGITGKANKCCLVDRS